MSKMRLTPMIEAAVFAALAVILDLLPSIRLSPAISISFAMVPVFIVAFRWGLRAGLISGFLWGLLQVVLGDIYFLTPLQFVIEYFVAFTFVGFAGLLYRPIQTSLKNGNRKQLLTWAIAGVIAGSLARYFWHFVAGFIFWGDAAPEGQSAVMYSLIANGITVLGAIAFCSIVIAILAGSLPRLLTTNQTAWNADRKAS
ncbi:energy-coupled thiamine transporter ThiT [Rossellomorea vietnamensis]|uniref:Energy-coupled thiamine transporter ThiT n=1 Tax=Rossellomorea vietnamensis TaxID=218284 RepID=A0A5D4MA34_9BACI|nr:energy-coupled thiamine transporter ThiT [Rossellomorea vietnamensis]TYR97855.1 energy-coupled thiamine transporter ThiT [Rossellomorea vietnamensis]